QEQERELGQKRAANTWPAFIIVEEVRWWWWCLLTCNAATAATPHMNLIIYSLPFHTNTKLSI
uniref:Uncharacterized protein n=1 Tax=Oryza brachyantha TaxID=4533 RepID=J3MYL0_ORYBR